MTLTFTKTGIAKFLWRDEMYNLPKCPFCMSLNVAPVGPRTWHCDNCGKDFPEAVVEQEPPTPKKGGK